jgi:hypothetical protein
MGGDFCGSWEGKGGDLTEADGGLVGSLFVAANLLLVSEVVLLGRDFCGTGCRGIWGFKLVLLCEVFVAVGALVIGPSGDTLIGTEGLFRADFGRTKG